MAQLIPPPENFNWQKPEEWEKWIKRFNRYLSATGVTDGPKQVNTLIYCMGSQAEDVLLGLHKAPLPDMGDQALQKESDIYVNGIMGNLPATENKLGAIREAQQEDPICEKVMQYTQLGWPEKQFVSGPVLPYMQYAPEFTIQDGLLLKNCRIVIPTCMRLEILDRLHDGHLGIFKCRERAKQSVWWPGLSKELENLIKSCNTCSKCAHDQAEPLMPSPLPDRPWQKIAADLKEFRGKNYLVVVDYYSRYIEMAFLGKNTTASSIITHLKSMFARHGIAEILVSDNGPNFENKEFQEFRAKYGFTHITSSPRYPRSNGAAERAVQTFKNILIKNDDPYLALLVYRATPIHNGYSPAELLMGRKLRTTLPIPNSQLQPLFYLPGVREKEIIYKAKMKNDYDIRHRARELDTLLPGQNVYIKDNQKTGEIQQSADNAPRSYIIHTPQGDFRRNRRALVRQSVSPMQNKEAYDSPDLPSDNNVIHRSVPDIPVDTHRPVHETENFITPPRIPQTTHTPQTALRNANTTRSGRLIKIPDKLNL